MKTQPNTLKITTLLAATLIPLAIATVSNAQNAQGANTPTNTATGSCKKEHHHPMREALENLTQSERQQLRAAMEKIHQDPQLVAARQAAREAHASLKKTRHDLLVKVDPTLEAVLAKIKSSKEDEGE